MIETGKRFGNLVCIGKDPSKDSRYYLFKCDCGNVKSIIQDSVKRGATISCGCYRKKNPAHLTYGFSHTRIDNIFKSMIDRCENPKSYNYHKYGARGIRVCNEWKTNKVRFFEWAFSNGYSESLTLDRIDNSKGYSPNNCRWVTYKVQNNNRRNNHRITAFGMEKTMSEWSDYTGIKASNIYCRLKKGWSVEKALTKEVIKT